MKLLEHMTTTKTTTTENKPFLKTETSHHSTFVISEWVGNVIITDVTLGVHHAKRFHLKLCLDTAELVNGEQHVTRTIYLGHTKRCITHTLHHRL